MEKVWRQKIRSNLNGLGLIVLLAGISISCSTKQIMEDTDPKFSNIDEEYAKVVNVKEIGKKDDPKSAKSATPANAKASEAALAKTEKASDKAAASKTSAVKTPVPKASDKNPVTPVATGAVIPPKPDGYDANSSAARPSQLPAQKNAFSKLKVGGPREPSIEDSEGMTGRRPTVDPFTIGEKVTLTATYLNIQAGDMSLEVLPFKEVNDRKAYHLKLRIISSKTFNMFYAVNNTAETFLDYETMIPQTLTYDGKESSRIREYRTFFDWAKMEAFQWRREVSKKKGETKKKLNWPIEPYSQNILSAVYYLRTFKLTPGKKYSFRVADEGKNYVFSANVLRREKLQTDLGEFNTLVIQPDYKIDGKFTPAGTNTIWVTDDERRLPVRVEAKVKIGSFIAKLKSIEGVKYESKK